MPSNYILNTNKSFSYKNDSLIFVGKIDVYDPNENSRFHTNSKWFIYSHWGWLFVYFWCQFRWIEYTIRNKKSLLKLFNMVSNRLFSIQSDKYLAQNWFHGNLPTKFLLWLKYTLFAYTICIVTCDFTTSNFHSLLIMISYNCFSLGILTWIIFSVCVCTFNYLT